MTAPKLRRLIFHGPLRLRSQLTLLVLVTVLPLILFSGVMIYLLAERQRATYQQGATERMRALATAVDAEIKGSITTLDALASNEDLRNGNLRGFYDAAARVLKTQPDWSTINLADRSGKQIINLLRPFGAELPKVQAPAEINQVLETGRPVIGDILLGPVTKQYDAAVRVPVFNYGVLSYVLSAVIKPESIGKLLSAQQLPSDWNGLVLDGNNRFVTRSIGFERSAGQLASQSLRAALARSPDGWFRGINIDGRDVYTAYSRSPFSGWTVAMNVPANVVDAPLRGPVLYVILLGAGLLASGIALAWWLSSRIAGSIEALVQQVTDLGLGKTAADNVPTHVAEVDHLGKAFSAARRLIQRRSEERDQVEEVLRQDVTQRKRAEDALQQSQAQFSGIINSAMDAIIALDRRQRIVLFNPAAEEMFGYTSTEAVGKSLDQFIPPRFREAHRTHIENFGQTGVTSRRMGALGALSALRANGEEFPIEASISQLELGGGKLFTVILRDITERERADTARKRVAQLLAEAARQKEVLYQFVDRRHRAKSLDEMYAAALDAILSALGCQRASILVSDESGVMRFTVWRGLSAHYRLAVEGHSPWKPDDADPQPVCIPDIKAAELDESLKTVANREGIAALAFIPLILNGKLAGELMTYYNESHVFSDEELDLSLTLAHHLAVGLERRQAEDKIAQLNEDLERRVKERTDQLQETNTALLRDIEERKKLEAQLLQSQKMESIGTLAGGLAHDFNNILNIIQGYASELSEHGAQNQEINESLAVINETVQRGSTLVKKILTMARKSPDEEFAPVDVNGLIESLLPLIKETFPKTVELSSTLESNLPPIMADKIQIEQVLLNLCVNARDAMPNGGRLSFKTSLVDGASLQPLGDQEQCYVSIEVSDTGMGIDESIREHIFEPFFTTKEITRGTGLGLSMVYGIVKNHAGLIDVESKPMAGATFRLYLPVTTDPAMIKEPPVEVAAERPVIVKGTETVLLVEDEANMLHLLERMFLRRGYKILAATDGESALDLYQQHQAEIDIVLLDLGLPKISGPDMVAKIISKNPDVKVIVTSGYIDPVTKSQLEHARVRFLHKPYLPEDVFKALRNLAAPTLV